MMDVLAYLPLHVRASVTDLMAGIRIIRRHDLTYLNLFSVLAANPLSSFNQITIVDCIRKVCQAGSKYTKI